MKRLLCMMIALIMLCAAGAACAEAESLDIISCPEAGLSTKIPAGKTWAPANDGVIVWLGDEGYVPNLWLYVRKNKLNDPVSYLHETFTDYMKNEYGDRLAGINKFEYYEIAGKKLSGIEYSYRGSDDTIIYQLNLVEALEDADIEYQARYTNSTREMVLNALETAITCFQADPDYYTAAPAPEAKAPAAAAGNFKVTNIKADDMIIGRCVAPEEYTVTSRAFCCTEEQSAGNPWLLAVSAISPEGVGLTYSSAQNFYTVPGADPSLDGTFHMKFMTPILHYMNAAEYCDYWAKRMNGSVKKIELVKENNYPELQEQLDKQAEAYKGLNNRLTAGSGLTVSKVKNTMAARIYYMESDTGLPYYFVVATATRGVWYDTHLDGPIVDIDSSYILWDSPCVYTMLCPPAMLDSVGDVLTTFIENTSVTDQFMVANQRVSTEILSMMTGINLSGLESYSRKFMQEETAKGDDYSEERFSDYIFDQNDYTLSDGSHVKVPTNYEYVWEGDNGMVYYSDSAFAQPGGSTQLTPNR